MPYESIKNKLTKLSTSQSTLRSSMIRKGVVAADNEHYPTLVQKVDEIDDKTYALEGIMTLTSSAYTFSIQNLSIDPKEFGFVSEDLKSAYISGSGNGYVVPDMHVTFEDDVTTKTVDDCVITKEYDESSNSWSISLSFEAYNTSHPESPKRFQGGYSYTWLALSHALYKEETVSE